MSNLDGFSGSNYTFYNDDIELPRVSSIPSSPRRENPPTAAHKNNALFIQEDVVVQPSNPPHGVHSIVEPFNHEGKSADDNNDKTCNDNVIDDKPLFVPCPPSKPKPSNRIVRAQVHPKPRHQPKEDQFSVGQKELSFNKRLPALSKDDSNDALPLQKTQTKSETKLSQFKENHQSTSTPHVKSATSVNKIQDKKNNISRDQRLIDQYKELLNERFRDSSSESETEGKDFTVSVSSLSSDEETTDEADNQLEAQTLTQEKFEPLYSLPIKKSKKINENSFNSILISNSYIGGSQHRTGSLPDLRSIAELSLRKVSHVTKNESEAESEPGAKIGYKFKPLPPIPGTSSNINNTGLYETIDGLSRLSNNSVAKNDSVESTKRKTFKDIATILTLVPRLTTNSVRSRKNDHRLADITKYLPEKKLKIFVGTWNMKGTKFLPSLLDDFLLPPESIYLQDIYVIGTQEGTPFRREWQVRLQETFGPSHVLMQASNFGVLQLSIFVRRELVWFCSSVEQDTIATRVGHKIKTKGALAMSFSIFGTSFCFITSHFTSDKEKLSQRINDYRTINRGIRLPVIPGTKYEKSDVTDRFDRVFWFGDFNFRIQKSRESVDRIMKRHARNQPLIIQELLAHDQLNEVFDRGKIFHGFKESEIHFMPTYKFDVNTDQYDSSPKKRVPSWTDRIVYKSVDKSLLKCLSYNSCNTTKVSDHRPVYGIFESEVEPYKDKFTVPGATFDREIYVEANLRRNAPSGSQSNSHVCTIL